MESKQNFEERLTNLERNFNIQIQGAKTILTLEWLNIQITLKVISTNLQVEEKYLVISLMESNYISKELK